jgi:hypothetical protein
VHFLTATYTTAGAGLAARQSTNKEWLARPLAFEEVFFRAT